MRTFPALLTGALLCAAAFAQSEPTTAPGTGTASPSQAQPGTPPAQQPDAQPRPQQPPQQNQSPAAANASNSTAPAGQPRIAPGSVIPVLLTKTIDAKKAKQGDQVVARVTMDMKTNTGEVLVPKDTKVIGHVTEAQARSKEQKESQLAIAFDRAVLKNGEVNLPMSIQAVVAPPSNNGNNGDNSAQGSSSPSPSSGGATGASPTGGGRTGGAAQTQTSNRGGALPPDNSNAQEAGGRPPINGNTQGVVGISNLKLEAAQSGAQGSVLSSEKNNVKVEGGTMLLLKVTQ